MIKRTVLLSPVDGARGYNKDTKFPAKNKKLCLIRIYKFQEECKDREKLRTVLARPGDEAPPGPEASRLDCFVITWNKKNCINKCDCNHHRHHQYHQHQHHQNHEYDLSNGVPSSGHRLLKRFNLFSHRV